MSEIEWNLKANAGKMSSQYRDSTKKNTFSFKSSFVLGYTEHVLGANGFRTPHNFKKGRGVCTTPMENRKLPPWQIQLWNLSEELIRQIDPHFADGEYCVQYACMNDPDHYVHKHVDKENISHQYALALGDYKGEAVLRLYEPDGETVKGEFEYNRKFLKADGRFPHELFTKNFSGTRFSLIYFKVYDHRKTECDPLMDTPMLV